MFISKQIGSKERAYRQEESYCNVSRYICSCRENGDNAHKIACKYKEKYRQKIRRVFLVMLFPNAAFYNIVIYTHYKHPVSYTHLEYDHPRG